MSILAERYATSAAQVVLLSNQVRVGLAATRNTATSANKKPMRRKPPVIVPHARRIVRACPPPALAVGTLLSQSTTARWNSSKNGDLFSATSHSGLILRGFNRF
jgi:hypothetical protein